MEVMLLWFFSVFAFHCRYSRGKNGHTQDFGPALANEGFFGVGNHPQHQDTSYKKSIWGKERLQEAVK